MNPPIYLQFDINTFLFGTVLILLTSYSAWQNLVMKRISKYGFDGLILKIAWILDKDQTQKIYKSPILIRRMGIMMLLITIGGIPTLVGFFIDRIWPFL